MSEGKLKRCINHISNTFVGTIPNLNKRLDKVVDKARADILKLIKEYEYEDIPDDIMKAKIIEWFGDEE